MEDIPEAFRFLKNSEKPVWEFSQKKKYDLFIVLDCSSEDRLGDALAYFKDAERTLCFDHHISNGGFAGDTVLHADYSSTSEVLFTCMDEKKISKAVAEALYLGIVHDTGVFQYSCAAFFLLAISSSKCRRLHSPIAAQNSFILAFAPIAHTSSGPWIPKFFKSFSAFPSSLSGKHAAPPSML